LIEVVKFLKEDPAFQMNFLIDLTAVDYLTFGKQPPAKGAFFNYGVPLMPPTELPDEKPWPVASAEGSLTRRSSALASAEGSLTTAPWPGPATTARFEVVYHFFSLPLKHRVRLKVPVEESKPEVDSLTPLWPGANWFEREVWDMFGIHFRGHPSLKRILMYEEFTGHPLRKDYPVKRRQPLIGPVN